MDSAKKGGIFIGKSHSEGGIKAVVDGGKPIEVEGGEIIINKESSKLFCKELSDINQAGGGVAISCGDVSDNKDNFKDGGLVKSISSNLENLNKNGIVLKKDNVTVILYNTGGQSRSLGLYNSTLLYNTIKPINPDIANKIVVMLNNGIHDEFQEGKDYSNDNLIIMNQNDVVYNGNRKFEQGGKVEELINKECDFYVRWSGHIKSDLERGWSSWNFGQEGFEGSFEELEELKQKAVKGDYPFHISGFDLWDNDIKNADIRELYHNYWVLVDNTKSSGIAGHYIDDEFESLDDIKKLVEDKKGKYNGTGDGDFFDTEYANVVYSQEKEGKFGYHIIEVGCQKKTFKKGGKVDKPENILKGDFHKCALSILGEIDAINEIKDSYIDSENKKYVIELELPVVITIQQIQSIKEKLTLCKNYFGEYRLRNNIITFEMIEKFKSGGKVEELTIKYKGYIPYVASSFSQKFNQKATLLRDYSEDTIVNENGRTDFKEPKYYSYGYLKKGHTLGTKRGWVLNLPQKGLSMGMEYHSQKFEDVNDLYWIFEGHIFPFPEDAVVKGKKVNVNKLHSEYGIEFTNYGTYGKEKFYGFTDNYLAKEIIVDEYIEKSDEYFLCFINVENDERAEKVFITDKLHNAYLYCRAFDLQDAIIENTLTLEQSNIYLYSDDLQEVASEYLLKKGLLKQKNSEGGKVEGLIEKLKNGLVVRFMKSSIRGAGWESNLSFKNGDIILWRQHTNNERFVIEDSTKTFEKAISEQEALDVYKKDKAYIVEEYYDKKELVKYIMDEETPLIPAIDYSQPIQDSINALHDINPREASKLKLLQYVLNLEEKTSRVRIEKYAKELGLQHGGFAEQKIIKEITELAIVLEARGKNFEDILQIYKDQSNLSQRTSETILLQQYSTSLPIAWIIGKFCQLNKEGRYFEPSAGNGMLTIYGEPKNFTVNDIDKDRIWSLKKQGFKEVLNQDGKEPFDLENFDAIITNPPFGAVEKGQLYKGVKLSKLEHKMSANALELLKKDGKAAIIVGGHLEYEENKIKGLQDWFYFVYLASNYNVVDVININSRALYHKMGTTFNLKIILIDGCKHKPVNIESDAYESIDNWIANKDLPQSEKFSIEPVSSFEILNKRVNG